MKITKFVHSCLLVETPGYTALFDPGAMSAQALNLDAINKLDDLFITHEHGDHFDPESVKKIVAKFPEVRITTTAPVVSQLEAAGIKASTMPGDNATLFESPHEDTEPLFPRPLQIGVHFDHVFSHPGDSHSFTETMHVLALPVTAPWGSVVSAVKHGLELRPQYIVPIHDWHWSDDARQQTYDLLEKAFGEQRIIFLKPETGKPINIDIV
ncbi:MAG: hypothetical protein JWO41_854 [Candidatus Saccharibacteria bacterium]|nr:hypothetical protein [Candidatus Saccharibacteria bacterium]